MNPWPTNATKAATSPCIDLTNSPHLPVGQGPGMREIRLSTWRDDYHEARGQEEGAGAKFEVRTGGFLM